MKKFLTVAFLALLLMALVCVPAWADEEITEDVELIATDGAEEEDEDSPFFPAVVESITVDGVDYAFAELVPGPVTLTIRLDQSIIDFFVPYGGFIILTDAEDEEVEAEIVSLGDGVYTLTFQAELGSYMLDVGYFHEDEENWENSVYQSEACFIVINDPSYYEPAYPEGPYQDCEKDDTCPLADFSDLSPSAWYHDGVHYCLESGLMSGVGGGRFDPSVPFTRAMLATVLYRQAGSPQAEGDNPFADVSEGDWYYDAVVWAYNNGVVYGVSDDQFAPMRGLTRQEMAVMLFRFMLNQYNIISYPWMVKSFPDMADVAEWAEFGMDWCLSNRILGDVGDGTLSPTAFATRAQVATILLRFNGAVADY